MDQVSDSKKITHPNYTGRVDVSPEHGWGEDAVRFTLKPIEIDEYDLPIIDIMHHQTYSDGPEFHRVMIDILNDSDQIECRWALEIIARLQLESADALDRLIKIEELAGGRSTHG